MASPDHTGAVEGPGWRARLARLIRPQEELRGRVVQGAMWILGLNMATRSLTLLRTIVLARLLTKDDFGTMGIALLAMSALDTFTETGFSTALIQKKDDIRRDLDTAWTVGVFRGAMLAVALFVASPLIARFFQVATATPIMRMLAVALLLRGFNNIGIVYFSRELEFNRQFAFRILGLLGEVLVAIPAALIMRSVWALAYGAVSGAAVGCVASYLVHPYRPRLRFDPDAARALVGYGRWVTGSTIMVFLITQGDNAVVGKLLGVGALGLYQMAYRISNMPTTEIAAMTHQVTFPAYSKLQDDLPRLRQAYLKTLRLTGLLALPLSVGILVLAPDFTHVLLGSKWAPMLPCLGILCAFGALRALVGTMGPVALAVNRPDIRTFSSLAQLMVLASLIIPLTHWWDIAGTAVATLAGIIVGAVVLGAWGLRTIGLRLGAWVQALIPGLVVSGLIALVSLPVHLLIAGPSGLRLLILCACVPLGFLACKSVWIEALRDVRLGAGGASLELADAR
jgi:lipopolysaccharide exporter